MKLVLFDNKSLRIDDNPAFDAALDDRLIPVYVKQHTPLVPGASPVKKRFLDECLLDLDARLRKYYDTPLLILSRTKDLLNMIRPGDLLCYTRDLEPIPARRNALLVQQVKDRGAEVQEYPGNNLFDIPEVWKVFLTRRRNNHSIAPMNMHSFLKLISSLDSSIDYRNVSLAPLRSEKVIISKLEGGESAALGRLYAYMSDPEWVARFAKPETNPCKADSTTVLSPYISHGCLSVRRFWQAISNTLDQAGLTDKGPPVSLKGQLLWREFFYLAGYAANRSAGPDGSFHLMKGNPLCRQLPWQENEALLHAWAHGKTGFPWIDAIMNQLRTEGWISHLARHAVACFLTRGNLKQSWEKGAQVFMQLLLDGDYFLNTGNWLWVSSSAFFYQSWRVYHPIKFPLKYEGYEEYIKKYNPVSISSPRIISRIKF